MPATMTDFMIEQESHQGAELRPYRALAATILYHAFKSAVNAMLLELHAAQLNHEQKTDIRFVTRNSIVLRLWTGWVDIDADNVVEQFKQACGNLTRLQAMKNQLSRAPINDKKSSQ